MRAIATDEDGDKIQRGKEGEKERENWRGRVRQKLESEREGQIEEILEKKYWGKRGKVNDIQREKQF